MSTFKERRCRNCGKGTVRLKTRRGRREPYKTLVLKVPAHVAIPTCDHCGAEWHNESTAKAFDAAMEQVYRAELRKRVVAVINRITKHVSQKRLEQVLGLSAGYISKVRVGDREPSAELVSELALIARDPQKRIQELEEFWTAA